MTLRPACLADLEQILRLDAACFARPWTADAYRSELGLASAQERPDVGAARPTRRSFVALIEDAGQIVAVICGFFVGTEGEILRVATEPRVRRRGLAARLLQSMLARARQVGCDSLHLEVANRNAAARCLYRRFGFVEVGHRVGYYADDDAVLMTCRLSEAGRPRVMRIDE